LGAGAFIRQIHSSVDPDIQARPPGAISARNHGGGGGFPTLRRKPWISKGFRDVFAALTNIVSGLIQGSIRTRDVARGRLACLEGYGLLRNAASDAGKSACRLLVSINFVAKLHKDQPPGGNLLKGSALHFVGFRPKAIESPSEHRT
jgi:hypothetical protein